MIMEPTYYAGQLPEITVYGKQNWERIAANERNRQRNIADAYLKESPSIQNLYKAALAWWNSLPFNTTSSSVNPNIHIGEPPILPTNASYNTLSTAQKLSNAAKIQNAKSLAIRRANAAAKAAAKKAAEEQAYYESLQNTLNVKDLSQNYVVNEAERAAAIDFLKENPKMFGKVNTNVMYPYYDESYAYPHFARFDKLLYPRKTLKQVRKELDSSLRSIRNNYERH